MAKSVAEVLHLVNFQAERRVLAEMLADAAFAAEATEKLLDETCFYDEANQLLFSAIGSLQGGFELVDADTVMSEARHLWVGKKDFPVSSGYVDDLPEPTGAGVTNAALLRKLRWLRQAGEYAVWLSTEIQKNPNIDSLFTDAQSMWSKLSPKVGNNGFTYAWDTFPEYEAQLAKAKERTTVPGGSFTWPWKSWNDKVRPLQNGMIGLISMADGQGKSTAMEQIAEHWAKQNLHVVVVHLEDMPDYKYNRRMARWSGVPIDRLEDGTLTQQDEVAIKEANEKNLEWAGLYLHYYHAPGLSAQDIIRELERRAAEGLCQSVIIDYYDKLGISATQSRTFRGDGAQWLREADNVEQFKIFAERTGVPLMGATQGNASMYDASQRHGRGNIGGSKKKSHKSQLVIVGSRAIVPAGGMYNRDGKLVAEPDEYSPITKWVIDKQNRGKTGSISQWLVAGRFMFVDMQT